MAAKGALLELFEKKSLSRNEKYQNVLACARKHKMGVDSLLRFAKDSLRVEEDILDTLGTTVEDIISKLVDVALRTDDSADTVCVPRTFLSNLMEKIDKQMEMMADLEVRLLNEMKMRESRIADLIKSSKTSQPCSSAESSGTKPSKRKRARVTNDNKPSVNWGDDDFSSEEEQSEKKKKENSEAAREKIQTASTVTDSIVPPATRSEISAAPSSKRQPVPPARTRSSTSGKSKTSIDLNPMASDDDSWTLVGARKPGPKRSVLYIGNLNAECTEEKLMAFVEGRAKTIGNAAPKVFNAKIYTTKSESGCLSARLTVAESDRALLQARNFWPRPIYARPWHFHLTSSKEGESKEISVVKVLKTSTCKDHDDKDGGAEPQPKCELDDALGQDHV